MVEHAVLQAPFVQNFASAISLEPHRSSVTFNLASSIRKSFSRSRPVLKLIEESMSAERSGEGQPVPNQGTVAESRPPVSIKKGAIIDRMITNLRQHPKVVSSMHFHWWISCSATIPGVDQAFVDRLVNIEWNGMRRRSSTMESFFDKLFSMVHNWCHSMNVDEYCDFLALLLYRIAHCNWSLFLFSWRSIDSIACLTENDHLTQTVEQLPYPNPILTRSLLAAGSQTVFDERWKNQDMADGDVTKHVKDVVDSNERDSGRSRAAYKTASVCQQAAISKKPVAEVKSPSSSLSSSSKKKQVQKLFNPRNPRIVIAGRIGNNDINENEVHPQVLPKSALLMDVDEDDRTDNLERSETETVNPADRSPPKYAALLLLEPTLPDPDPASFDAITSIKGRQPATTVTSLRRPIKSMGRARARGEVVTHGQLLRRQQLLMEEAIDSIAWENVLLDERTTHPPTIPRNTIEMPLVAEATAQPKKGKSLRVRIITAKHAKRKSVKKPKRIAKDQLKLNK